MIPIYLVRLPVEGVLVRSYKGYILPILVGIGIALAVVLFKEDLNPQEVAQPIVCMQDAPIIYDWQGELITNHWHDGVDSE